MPSPRSIRSIVPAGVTAPLALLALAGALVLAGPASSDDADWPRQFESSSGAFVIYQPQAEELTGDLLSCRAAFSLQRSQDAPPTFGVLWFTERIAIDRDSSTVTARSLDVTRVRLPGITTADASRYETLVETQAKRWDLSGSLEELQAGLAATDKERASVADLSNAPPRIVFAIERSILVVYDGAPTLEPIEGSALQRVTNTPYAVVYDPASRRYYLNGANLWYQASDPLGPWTDIAGPPSAVRAIVPPDTTAGDRVEGPAPRVLTATEPTELIASDGPPRYAPLVGDELLYVTNTESRVVLEVGSQALYVLLAGRWYRAPSMDGPWAFVRGDSLPASFARIPADSPMGDVLASVAGTDEADDAVADAEIPQTTAIRRDQHDFEVSYDGEPDFEPIEGTGLRYAVNTDAEVLFAYGQYYACDQGVWYVADRPDGPWSVSDTRPVGIDDIPPSCPVYDTRYVYVFDTTPDVIYVGYLPGYVGSYPYYGTVVYGTGYHYRPWRGRHHFYPRPLTWGCHPRYNPWLTRWSFGYSYGVAFLRVGTRWHLGPQRTQRRGPPLWFGPGGYHRPLVAADRTPLRVRPPRPVRPSPVERSPANLYTRSENVVRVDRAALRMPVRQLRGPVAGPARLPNNVFAGQDGKVYQRDDRGNWKVNEGRGWKPTRLPAVPTTPPLPAGGTYGDRTRGTDRPGARPQPMPAQRPQPEPVQRPQPQPMPAQRQWPEPVQRPQPQPMPAQRQWPAPVPPAPRQEQPRPEQPRTPPAPRPAPPPISPTPGDLERDFHARERVSPAPAAPAPPPRQAPAREERPRDKRAPERKR